MIDEQKSRRVHNVTIVVVVVALAPVAIFASKELFLHFLRPTFSAPRATVLVIPEVTAELKKVGGKLEVSLIVRDRNAEPITGIDLHKLTVEGTKVVAATEPLGPVGAYGILRKRYVIPLPAKLPKVAAVEYDLGYAQAAFAKGTATGLYTVDVK